MQTINLVIAGVPKSGKTTFVQNFPPLPLKPSRKRQKVDDSRSTAPADFGQITVDETLQVWLFGAPPRSHPNAPLLWEILAEGMLGLVLVVDSTAPATFSEARQILQAFLTMVPVPFIVAANKQDQPNAIQPDALRSLLQLDANKRIVPCVATDPESARTVLLALMHAVLEDLNSQKPASL
jgi:signal recognition particle receptor subunit beta